MDKEGLGNQLRPRSKGAHEGSEKLDILKSIRKVSIIISMG